MNEVVPCKICNSSFQVTDSQQEFIFESRYKKMTFVMLECSICKRHTDFNPNSGVICKKDDSIAWRTPVSKINGYVSYIEDEGDSFYGCGESGFIWRTKQNFYKSIVQIIEKYPHRMACYKQINKDWFPSENEPQNIVELIASKEENSYEDFVIQ